MRENCVLCKMFVAGGILFLLVLAQGADARGGVWEDGLKIRPIEALNTPFKENEASFSQDGRTVYFACFGRSAGSPDICVSHLTGDYRQDRRHH